MAAAGRFALDLEFVSESRYVPELCLLQVAWGDPARPEIALLDPLGADVEPVLGLVAGGEVEVVLHAAQGDLALLASRFGIEGREVADTQIAAAFLGLGDQVGYASLVEQLTGVVLDKGAQFTNWCRRPLSDDQLRYAADDVRYLLRVWHEMAGRLEERGRLGWVREESARLARVAARRPPPAEMYRRVKGWERLPEDCRGAVRALASWREREALESNRPPQWILRDAPLVEVARRWPSSLAELGRVRGVTAEALRRHGRAILAAMEEGAEPPEAPPRRRRVAEAPGLGGALFGVVQERCREAGVAPRFVASRAAAEELALWWAGRGPGARAAGGAVPDLPLLTGWRRDLAGEAVLAWLASRAEADEAPEPAEEPPGEGGDEGG
jgi:ribonuclease D